MAYVLGFMFADGSLIDSNKSSRTYYLSFFNNDLNILTLIRDIMRSDHRIYIKPPRLMSHRNGRYISRQGYVLRIGNKRMYNDLLKLGLTHRKSNSMHLPDVPKEYFKYFLRGYFDGDGCINLYMAKGRLTNRVSLILTSGSTCFLEEIAQRIGLLLHINPPKYSKSTGAYNLLCRGVRATIILDYIYSDLKNAPYLEYKYQKYLEYRKTLIGPRVRAAIEKI